jgi:DNA-binding transcriptional regulator YbjK
LSERAIRGEARRDLILDAAIRVLGEEGLAALTHRRVAAEAGLPLAATTYWFASKEDLLLDAYRRAADRDIARVRRVVEQFEAGEGGDVARAITDVLGSEIADGRGALVACFTVWIEAARRPSLRPIEAEWTQAYEHAIAQLLARAGSPQPELDSQVLTAALDGLMLGLLARGGGSAEVDTQLRPQVERLVAALTAQPPR